MLQREVSTTTNDYHVQFSVDATLPVTREGHGIDLHDLLVKNPSATFFMQVTGTNPHLLLKEGDVLVVDRSLQPHPGDWVIVWSDNSFQLLQKSSSTIRITELPESDTDNQPDQVWGVVRWIIHNVKKSPLAKI
jgi:DNA polymerase V